MCNILWQSLRWFSQRTRLTHRTLPEKAVTGAGVGAGTEGRGTKAGRSDKGRRWQGQWQAKHHQTVAGDAGLALATPCGHPCACSIRRQQQLSGYSLHEPHAGTRRRFGSRRTPTTAPTPAAAAAAVAIPIRIPSLDELTLYICQRYPRGSVWQSWLLSESTGEKSCRWSCLL